MFIHPTKLEGRKEGRKSASPAYLTSPLALRCFALPAFACFACVALLCYYVHTCSLVRGVVGRSRARLTAFSAATRARKTCSGRCRASSSPRSMDTRCGAVRCGGSLLSCLVALNALFSFSVGFVCPSGYLLSLSAASRFALRFVISSIIFEGGLSLSLQRAPRETKSKI